MKLCPPKYPFKLAVFLCLLISVSGKVKGQDTYQMDYFISGKDTATTKGKLSLKEQFSNRLAAMEYILKLPQQMMAQGYISASVDSFRIDSLQGKAWIFAGKKYAWENLDMDSIPQSAKSYLHWNEKNFSGENFSYPQWEQMQEALLNYYADRGYPFANVNFSQLRIDESRINASLEVAPGILYKIDSIRVYGDVQINNNFLQHYLNIYNGEVYNRSKLMHISNLLAALPYLEESQRWDITMLGSGAILNLYLQPEKSSEVNVLIGFIPGNNITGKLQVTADVHLNLKNALGMGESILLNWQQFRPKSPKLDIGYNHPYLFNTPFGADLSFSLLKMDSSWLQLKGVFGIQYLFSAYQWVKAFYQTEQSKTLQGGVDTLQIINTHRLPTIIDVNTGSFGLGYHIEQLDYRLNPQKGFVLDVSGAAGLKRIDKNNDILQLKDPDEPAFDFNSLYDSLKEKSYRFSLTSYIAKYFSLGTNSVLKLAVHGGWMQSPSLFQNELFRIGGFQLLRGFDEESIYSSRYGVGTIEYRYLVGRNSFFYGFADVGLTHAPVISRPGVSHSYISGGLGLEFQTSAGLLQITYAIGKRDDVKFNWRNASKIHFGYINYF